VLVVPRQLLFIQLALRMRIEIGAVASQRVHEQHFGVQALRTDAAVFQPHDRRAKNVFELHKRVVSCLLPVAGSSTVCGRRLPVAL